MKIVRPYITLLVLVVVALLCISLMAVFPKQGIQLGGAKLKFLSLDKFFGTDSVQNQPQLNIEERLAMLSDSTDVNADSLSTDSLNVKRHQSIAALQFADGKSDVMFPFFQALDNARSKPMHIFHYGDSQIESDRMSGIVRQKLQEKFGGIGPGLVAPIPITASANIAQTQSANWTRHTAYGFDNGKAAHNKYGVMCAFGRFTPAKSLDAIVPTDSVDAWIELRQSGMTQGLAKQYTNAILYFGNHQYGFHLEVYADEALVAEEDIPTGSGMMQRKWSFASAPKKIKFVFKGADSPDVYGIELHGNSGVCLSNLALRGNDGTALRRVNNTEVQTVFNDLNAELIILQFGGNNVPYLKDSLHAFNQGKGFASTIRKVKQMAPGVPIVVIGPSDMSISIDGVFQTYPFLEELNNGMKRAAFDEGCAYWDMFSVMGGKNSMVSWVTNNPPYAGPDYVHFTPAGARKMGELLFKAINDEYTAWKNAVSPNDVKKEETIQLK